MDQIKVYAAKLKNEEERMLSSSGGAFRALSEYVIRCGGAIVSALYNFETNQMEFELYTDRATRDRARGSKYLQAKCAAYEAAFEWTKKNSGPMLFAGTGCQTEAFRKYAMLKGFREQVILVDLVCHGVPSSKIWREYVNGSIEEVTFKDKQNGWNKPTAYVVRDGVKETITDYVKLFQGNCMLRPSCYVCPFATTRRNSDITIGDYWGIERVLPDFEAEKGVSLLLVYSEKGNSVWNQICDSFEWQETSEKDCLQPNLEHPTCMPDYRAKFWRDYRRGGVSKLVAKYATPATGLRRIVKELKRIIK